MICMTSSTLLLVALEVTQAQWCSTILSRSACQSVSLWGPYKPFPFSVEQVVGWERKKLLGYLAAVRYQTTILGFYSTKFSIQDDQVCIHMQTLSLMSRGTISSQSVSLTLGGTNRAEFTWQSVIISMMRYSVGNRVDLGG